MYSFLSGHNKLSLNEQSSPLEKLALVSGTFSTGRPTGTGWLVLNDNAQY